MTAKLYFIAPFFLIGCALSNANNSDNYHYNSSLAETFDYCNWVLTEDGETTELPFFKVSVSPEVYRTSPDEHSEALVKAGTGIARNASSTDACQAIFTKGQNKFETELEASVKKHWTLAKYEKSEDKTIAHVQAEMATHWVNDQAARRVYIASKTDDKTGADYWTRSLTRAHTSKMDAQSTEFMKNLLNKYDWIDRNRFGDRVSMAAWLLVQHADAHVELQSLALSRMEPYLKTGGVSKSNYAFLWDRVAVNSGEKQRYGTQPTWECTAEGKLTLQPLEDPDNVNARRKTMGLGSVEDGLEDMARNVCR